jgi:hypothetical protein
MAQLTKAQANVLETLRTMPKKYRHQQTAGGWILPKHTQVYDQRTFDSLLRRGLLEVSEFGYRAK